MSSLFGDDLYDDLDTYDARDDLIVVYKNPGSKGLAPWTPRDAHTKRTLAYIQRLLREQAAYWPLGPRRIGYIIKADGRCIAIDLDEHGQAFGRRYDKGDFKHIERVLNRGRRAGLIPWEAISDGRGAVSAPQEYEDEAALVADLLDTANRARLVRQAGQEQVLEIHVEARESISQIDALAHEYGIAVYSGSGSGAIKGPRDLALRALRRGLAARRGGRFVITVVLHIGDHDPKGVEIFNVLRMDAVAHIRDELAWAGVSDPEGIARLILSVERIAPLPSQIADPVNRIATEGWPEQKAFDQGHWREEWGHTCEAEAIPPDVLDRILREAIESRMDLDLLEEVGGREGAVRVRVVDVLQPLADEITEENEDE